MADNTVTIVGNVTRDPELRYTAGGQANANFGVAVNRRWMNRQTNEWEERVRDWVARYSEVRQLLEQISLGFLERLQKRAR